jgi:hypothetical protein
MTRHFSTSLSLVLFSAREPFARGQQAARKWKSSEKL